MKRLEKDDCPARVIEDPAEFGEQVPIFLVRLFTPTMPRGPGR